MGRERVLQLARHHGRAANCVSWITGAKFFICENECMATARLETGQRLKKNKKTLVLIWELNAFNVYSSD